MVTWRASNEELKFLTLIVQHFIKLFMHVEYVAEHMSILPIHQQFQVHLLISGPDKRFVLSVCDIYNYLHTCQIKGTYKFDSTKYLSLTHRTSRLLLQQTKFKNTKYMVRNTQSGIAPRTQSTKCKICFHSRLESRCESRGPNWIPDGIRQNATKYNAQQPTDTPDPLDIKADPPLRYTTTHQSFQTTTAGNSGATGVGNYEDNIVYIPKTSENTEQLSYFIVSLNDWSIKCHVKLIIEQHTTAR